MFFFVASIFLSAFLLFQLEPMVGKMILPWFGGTPAVWSTLMLVYQVLLTGGYAYATWLIRRRKRQWFMHLDLLGLSIIVLALRGLFVSSPVMPSMSASLQTVTSPIWEIIKMILFSVGFPFFMISSNGPLIQVWFSRMYPRRSYAPLYAISNAGSLLGLLTYPFLVEPNFSLRSQGWLWSLGFLCFGFLTSIIAIRSGRTVPSQPEVDTVRSVSRPSSARLSLWLALSATASLFLLSVTNQISQDVAVIPFLWILPLTVYLLSFILTFSGERGYHRKLYAYLFVASGALTLYVLLNATRLHVYWQILAYVLLLFTACMICHGELYLLRPSHEHLTTFYLMVSIGGAVSAVFVTLIAPLLFNGYWEFFIALAMAGAVLLTVLRSQHEEIARARFLLTIFLLLTVMLSVLSTYFSGALFAQRNFYGVIRVREVTEGDRAAYVMLHGITVHGMQFLSDFPTSKTPTTYYVPDSGVGLAILNHPKYGHNQRVGLLGLGAGTLLAYSQPGDIYRLYEINPAVVDLAAGMGDYFSFVSDSPADLTTISGDARLSLQHELDAGQRNEFDILVLDTFSSDAIPVHLATRESFALYLAHLAPDGIIAAHITNLHLDLQPVFWQLARYYGLSMVRVNYPGDPKGGYASHWILLSRDPALLQIPAIQEHSVDLSKYSTNLRLWTDDYSNLFQILK